MPRPNELAFGSSCRPLAPHDSSMSLYPAENEDAGHGAVCCCGNLYHQRKRRQQRVAHHMIVEEASVVNYSMCCFLREEVVALSDTR